MCLNIDPDSVIHKHLVKKFNNESWGSYTSVKQVEKWRLRSPSSKSEDAYHSLTMLPSFHISLGAPKKEINAKAINNKFYHLDMVPIIGDIALAPICISKKDNKKSAWIPLHFHWIVEAVTKYPGDSTWKALNLGNFDSFDHQCDEYPVQHLHVSIANLTGNPHDSIARPEDCVIDTIKN